LDQLAINGGRPVRSNLLPPWPSHANDEIEAVSSVLRTGKVNYWTGEQGRAFEMEFADYIGMPYGIALCNGTLALELALYALGIGPGDEVIVPSRTFIATASAVVMRGATPVVADIDPRSQNLHIDAIRAAMTSKTRAIIAVHLGGWPCKMDEIINFAKRYDLKVIEDCAQAHGADFRGKKAGSFGDAAAFSFCQDKIMTTGGEGGMLLLRDEALWKKAWAFKDHGKDYDAVQSSERSTGFKWLHHSFGTNWRMTEMQAVLGRVQLKRLSSWLESRRRNAEMLIQGMSGLPALYVPEPDAHEVHAYYRFYVFVESDKLKSGWNRNRIEEAIVAEGIPCFFGSCSEIYREKAFDSLSVKPHKPLPVSHGMEEKSLAFLVHPTLGEREMRDTCQAVKKVMHYAAQ